MDRAWINRCLVAATAAGLALLAGCDGVGGDPPASVQQAAREYLDQSRVRQPSPSDVPGRETRHRPVVVAASPLIEPLEERSPAETAADALGRIGAAAVPQVRALLHDPDPNLRKQAAEILARIGPEAQPAVEDLTALLTDNDADVRKAAARALGQIGDGAALAVPELVRTVTAQPQSQ